MDKPTVYLETSVISYATARISRDVVTAARQQVTAEWFRTKRHEYELYVSQLVRVEAAGGDTTAAAARLKLIEDLAVLEIPSAAAELAARLSARLRMPPPAADDALHLAIAAVDGIDYLLSWNFRHIVNPTQVRAIDSCCRDAGFEPPVICTPAGLLAEEPNV